MAILDFQKPDKVIMIQSDEHEGQFEFRPLEPGYGITVGNALRRILLSSLEGFAISSIRIEGADHEFSTIKGIQLTINTEKLIKYESIDQGWCMEKHRRRNGPSPRSSLYSTTSFAGCLVINGAMRFMVILPVGSSFIAMSPLPMRSRCCSRKPLCRQGRIRSCFCSRRC